MYLVYFLIIGILFIYFLIPKEISNDLKKEILNSPQVESPIKSEEIIDIDLNSSNALLINLDENKILLAKNSEEIIYPASLTKIMTVLVAIENIPNLNEKIVLPNSIFKDLYKKMPQWQAFFQTKR